MQHVSFLQRRAQGREKRLALPADRYHLDFTGDRHLVHRAASQEGRKLRLDDVHLAAAQTEECLQAGIAEEFGDAWMPQVTGLMVCKPSRW